MATNNALALAPTSAPIATPAALAFEAQNAGECLTLARTLVASRLLPRAITTPEAAFAVIMTGRELGLTAMQSLRSIHIIEGKPTLSADLMIALVRRSPVCEYMVLVESTAKVATYEAKRKDSPKPTRMSFTIEDAERAGLLGKDNWRKFAPAMLRARCGSAICRAEFSDVMLGVYDPDEITPANDAPAEPVRWVEVETVDAPAANATPPETTEPEFIDTTSISVRAGACTTLAELDALARRIGRSVAKDDPRREEIRGIFAAHRAALTNAREPGAEV